MLQSFDAATRPDQGPRRLAALRAHLADRQLDGFLVPRADAHQGEYVAAHDDRLAWLTGFTGSAGFACVLPQVAGVFIDGRYRLQVRDQVDLAVFTPVDWPENTLAGWLKASGCAPCRLGFDPWLHTLGEIEALRLALAGTQIELCPSDNAVDAIWHDQPAPPMAPARVHELKYAGRGHDEKRRDAARGLSDTRTRAAVLSLPDSICWLLNIRGSDIPRNPVVHGFAILHDDAGVDLFIAPEKLAEVRRHLGPDVRAHAPATFGDVLADLQGPVRLDPDSAPLWIARRLEQAGVEILRGPDPCILPKACKNGTEIDGARAAHLRDGAAMVEFLSWLDAEALNGSKTEIDVVQKLESCRAATGALRDISFETIAGAGPNGAIVHYRVTRDSARELRAGEPLLIDSGGQYLDGTTDITRTVALGEAAPAHRRAFTLVLKGMIAISLARWPVGLTGRDLDPLARNALWREGMDYSHGTGHGVGSYLSVHEGPQRISRAATAELLPGMILSNEPGYYRDGAFGIRIENLVVVEHAPVLPHGDNRPMLCFSTLTQVPIDRRMIEVDLLSPTERAWIDSYHAGVRARLSPLVGARALAWLEAATEPL
ncbi:aminopeptidase P family protein [Brevirhabdus sp.]|uniref:aminopeptidase P family protein n=1 Tax=Brevirhabdus sp. TaxID=2004514 RepID=UPI0040581DA0